MLSKTISGDFLRLATSFEDRLRGTSADPVRLELITAVLLIKHLSDLWTDHYSHLKSQFENDHDAIEAGIDFGPVILTPQCKFDALTFDREQQDVLPLMEASLGSIRDNNYGLLADICDQLLIRIQTINPEQSQVDAATCELIDSLERLTIEHSNIAVSFLYEILLDQYVAKSRSDKTEAMPFEIGQLIVKLLAPKEGETLYDPSCGSGGMFSRVNEYLENKGTNSNSLKLYGQDRNISDTERCKIRLFLQSQENFEIQSADYLHQPFVASDGNSLQSFDVAVANNALRSQDWSYDIAANDPYHRFDFGIPPNRKGDYALILHMLASMKPDTGRMALVTNLGVLHRGGSEGEIRKNLIDANVLDTVIILPSKLFVHNSNQSVALLFRVGKVDGNVLFIDASNDFQSDKSQNWLHDEALAKIETTCAARSNQPGYSSLASRKDIAENDYSLNINHYVKRETSSIDITLIDLEKQRLELVEAQQAVSNRVDELIDSLLK